MRLKKWCRHIIIRKVRRTGNQPAYIFTDGCTLINNFYGPINFEVANQWKVCPKCLKPNPMKDITKRYVHHNYEKGF